MCLEQVGNKPATVTACNVGIVCPEWHIGAWQSVSFSCDESYVFFMLYIVFEV